MKEEKIKVGKNIYPDITNEEKSRILEKLNVFGILNIKFLIDDGLEFIFDSEKVEVKNYPGLISFYDTLHKSRILTVSDDFDSINFYGPGDYEEEEPITTIKIFI